MKPYYQDESVTIYHGDNRGVIPVLDRVDHVITDPPYSATTHAGARTGNQDSRLISFDPIDVDSLRGTLSLANPRRWTIATVDWRHVLPLEQNPPPGIRFVRFGVWVKPNSAPQFTGDRPATGWEAVVILHANDLRMRWNGGGRRGVWSVDATRSVHPTQKPLALVRSWILDFTDPGDLILDPFGGSGTTARAAKDMNRRCILVEREERWCEVAAKRMAQAAFAVEADV